MRRRKQSIFIIISVLFDSSSIFHGEVDLMCVQGGSSPWNVKAQRNVVVHCVHLGHHQGGVTPELQEEEADGGLSIGGGNRKSGGEDDGHKKHKGHEDDDDNIRRW